MPKKVIILGDEPIHGWFELTYAQYLTMPRSVLQSMPVEWQARFVKCLEELDEAIDWRPKGACYWVQLRRNDGKFIPIKNDPLMDYERGRRRIPLRAATLKEVVAMLRDKEWFGEKMTANQRETRLQHIESGKSGKVQ